MQLLGVGPEHPPAPPPLSPKGTEMAGAGDRDGTNESKCQRTSRMSLVAAKASCNRKGGHRKIECVLC